MFGAIQQISLAKSVQPDNEEHFTQPDRDT
jgi:hypothetical protein